ncbi:MAG: prepilin-type N-terminal cleavage/methylation domain-containing protein [Planctomycetota bacterium]|jgi:prepilin-type N-terminal cleavage/methylation domain-containing protein/prepilin-type processing-associated H-X9-DG protein
MRPTPIRRRAGFTIIEMLVVIGITGLLLGLLVPALSGVKRRAAVATCSNNLKQLGQATISYLNAYRDHLPQAAATNPFTGREEIIGTLFGGKRGQLAMFGIDQVGAAERPLNAFLGEFKSDPNDDGFIDEHVPVFECPLDRGQPAQPPFLPVVESMYDYVGSSYTLNDHSLDGEDCWTLVPKQTPLDPAPGETARPGGRMPTVRDPAKTWMLGDLVIYNFQEMGDRGQRWHRDRAECNLCFVDGHVGENIAVPPSTMGPDGYVKENTTADYTFLPSPDWFAYPDQRPNCGPSGP